MQTWNIEVIRAAFPALGLADEGRARVYVDAPAGTQVAGRAVERTRAAMVEACANEGGAFRTSKAAEALMAGAHEAAALFLGAGSADEVVFGLNTTSLLFSFAYMLSREWGPGDEIVVSRLDHDANVAPWLTMAEARGATVRWLEFDPATFEYRYATLDDLIGPRTRLVACNHASNLLGTISDVARIAAAARAVGAVSVVDAVQSAPHFALDARAIGCDILACSAYKFFGPHAGLLYLAPALRDRLKPLKVRPSPRAMPWQFAPGTPSFEAQAGTLGAIEHVAWIGERFGGAVPEAHLRDRLVAGWAAIGRWETQLMHRFLAHLHDIPGITIFGIDSPNRLGDRVPTFAFRIEGRAPALVAERLAERNIFVWAGNFYAQEIAATLGLLENGGVVRVGLSHYNTLAEVDAVAAAIAEIAGA
jgi:cysteine desulfurase family protein (TIGR01976 family)